MKETSSLQRFETAFSLGIPDRVPVFNVGGVSKQAIGVHLLDMMLNPKVQASAQIAAYRQLGHDSVSVGVDIAVEAEAMGCEIKFAEDIQPSIQPLVITLEDFDKIKIPDPASDGRMPTNIKAAKILQEKVGKMVDVSAWLAGPFSLAATVRGEENFLKDLVKRPIFAQKLLGLVNECQKIYGEAYLEEGIRTLCFPDPSASSSLISPRFFRTFALPYEKELFSYLKSKGARILLHICGDTTLILEEMVKSGANCLSVDQPPDIGDVKERVGNKVCLHGNVSTVNTLLFGSPSDVVKEARECIMKAGHGGGYLLGSSCDYPLMTPLANIEAMVYAAKKYGRYNPDGSLTKN
jgi:uroporphyrinogen decarboxylase